ncbi:hypothetical protein RN001_016002 [Aquatica leii]|uniref:Uncharacterized protein n=1 Tax=Aquatica leii TaxID=1421715 RepID=A0AAN7QB04_9COLE|nr:hypothetical protein RN001_016002 [Aquatica leii]
MISKQKFELLRKRQFEKRNEIISKIPKFWNVAFANHPDLRSLIDDDLLSYLCNFEVVVDNTLKCSYSLNFHFNDNPFFKNQILKKNFDLSVTGFETCINIPIQWKNKPILWDKDSIGFRKKQLMQGVFCRWYKDRNPIDPVAELIKEELWHDPLEFYINKNREDNDEIDISSNTDDDESNNNINSK